MSDIENLKLPEPLNVNKNILNILDNLEKKGETIMIFEGALVIETIFQLYLIKKYKSKCVIYAENKSYKRKRPIGITVDLKMKFTKDEENQMKEHFTQLSKILTECIKKGEKTIIIPLTYERGKGGHSNVLIYRKNTNELEHFEPHGGEYIGNEKIQNAAKKIMLLFTNILNLGLKRENLPEVKYIEASQVCPYIRGLQTLETNSKLKKKKEEPMGYCAAWSMFFTELCFKNPELSSNQVLDNIYNYLTTKPYAEDYLKKVIRGYSGFLVEKVNKYLEIFFKPKITVVDIISYHRDPSKIYKIIKLNDVMKILVELESKILLESDFNLEKELKETTKLYKNLTKNMTKEEEAQNRINNKKIQDLYYKKRILQNYEEYNKNEKITEPILDSFLEIKRETMINPKILEKKQLYEERDIQKKEVKKIKKSLKTQKKSPKTKTKKLKPSVIEESYQI
jgi:hypothetical protein